MIHICTTCSHFQYLPTMSVSSFMSNPMSMSMRVDRRSNLTRLTIKPRTPATWIPDARVRRCFACNMLFTTLHRKHHCRSCGRIFCSSCSPNRQVIPSYFQIFEHDGRPQRTCVQCTHFLKRTAKVEDLVRTLSHLPITMLDLINVRLLDCRWNCAVNTLLSMFRGLQYKLPCQQYSSIESAFLWTHHREFDGHVQWQIHSLAALHQHGRLNDFVHLQVKRHLTCRPLMCSRTCHHALSVDDIIRLGTSGCLSNPTVQKWVIATWRHMHPSVHIAMMFWWVYLSCRFTNLFKHGLVPICTQRLDLTYALFFECELNTDSVAKNTLSNVQERVVKLLSASSRSALSTSLAFYKCLLSLLKVPGSQRREVYQDFFARHRRVKLPWNTGVEITSIENVTRLLSSSKPLVLHCRVQNGSLLKLLLKNEDVRTDRLAMVISFWIFRLTKEVRIHTYAVFPLTPGAGVVEMLDNTTTLYEVKKSGSLLNFIMSNNDAVSVHELRDRIVSSCSGACLLAFTMGLGDRHLENILVTQQGYLVHVDFGWVFGADPKNAHTPMRITEDMVDAMGGKSSATFGRFVAQTKSGYETMRLHTSFWYHLLSSEYVIFHDRRHHWKLVRDHVLDRFVPGELDEEAALHIGTVVDNATNSSVLQHIVDLTHSASNLMTGMFHMDL